MKDQYYEYKKIESQKFTEELFEGCEFLECEFENCTFEECTVQNCRLNATQFIKNDIRGANFRGAAGYQIDITTNKMKNAKFSFPEVVSLLSGLDIKID